MRGNCARGLAACMIVLLLVQGEAVCSAAATVNRGMPSVGRFERRIYRTVPVASAQEATPEIADEEAIGGGLDGQGTITGAADLEELRAQRLKDLIGDLSVSLPTQVSFSIDLFETLGKGQVYSEDYCFQNFSNVDVRITLDNIHCEFSDKSHYQSLDTLEQMNRRSPKKLVYLYLEQMDGISNVATAAEAEALLPEQKAEAENEDGRPLGPGVVITDVPKEDSYSFILSADPNAENNQAHFRMTGAVNELSKYTWRSGEIRVKADFSIEPLIDEELLKQVDEEIQNEEALDDEILDEDELVWRLAQEEAERRRAEQEAAEKAKESTAAQPTETGSDVSKPSESGSEASQPSETEPDASRPSESEKDASQPTQPPSEDGNSQAPEPEGGQETGEAGEGTQTSDTDGSQEAGTDAKSDAGKTEGSGQDQDKSKDNPDGSGTDGGRAGQAEPDSGASKDDGADGQVTVNQKGADTGSDIGETSDG